VNRPPTLASISASPLINELDSALMGGTILTFTATSASDPDGDTLSYAWDFGDGVAAEGSAPTHVYNTGGACDDAAGLYQLRDETPVKRLC
jgi:hypothetical protein